MTAKRMLRSSYVYRANSLLLAIKTIFEEKVKSKLAMQKVDPPSLYYAMTDSGYNQSKNFLSLVFSKYLPLSPLSQADNLDLTAGRTKSALSFSDMTWC